MSDAISVNVNDFKYEIRIHSDNCRVVTKWCNEFLGKCWAFRGNRSGVWACFWAGPRVNRSEQYIFKFMNQKDAMWVALNWS